MSKLILITLFFAVSAEGQMTNWLMRGGTTGHTGWNSSETVMTQASIRARGLTQAVPIPLCCDARGMEAQPLVVAQSRFAADQALHDAIVTVSMTDDLRVVDAHTGTVLYDIDLAKQVDANAVAVLSTQGIDMHQINQHFGCLSTPVISARMILYASCQVSVDGTGNYATSRYYMFVVDVLAGRLVVPPVQIQSDANAWKQRVSLIEDPVHNQIILFHGSVFETENGYTGAALAFDEATNVVSAILPMSSGVWMGGGVPQIDANGYIMAITGNGDFSPAFGWFGESFVQLLYGAGLFKLPAWWSPYTDWQRTGTRAPAITTMPVSSTPNKTKLAGVSSITEAVRMPVGGAMAGGALAGARFTPSTDANTGAAITNITPVMASGAKSDEDLGSSAGIYIAALNEYCGAGKDGILYCLNTKRYGNTTLATAGTKANCALLAGGAPVFGSASPGAQYDPCPANPATLNLLINGKTAHVHAQLVAFYDPVLKQWCILLAGENNGVHKWQINQNTPPTYLGESIVTASANITQPPGGMPGMECTVSSNGMDEFSYLAFCAIPYGDGNASITQLRFMVFDPIHLTNGIMPVLWDSQQFGWQITYNKFCPPTIDGMVIYPDYGGRLLRFTN